MVESSRALRCSAVVSRRRRCRYQKERLNTTKHTTNQQYTKQTIKQQNTGTRRRGSWSPSAARGTASARRGGRGARTFALYAAFAAARRADPSFRGQPRTTLLFPLRSWKLISPLRVPACSGEGARTGLKSGSVLKRCTRTRLTSVSAVRCHSTAGADKQEVIAARNASNMSMDTTNREADGLPMRLKHISWLSLSSSCGPM